MPFMIRLSTLLKLFIFSYAVIFCHAQIPVWQGIGTFPEEGGNYYQCAQSPDGTLFVASAGSGVYSSIDDGKTWTQNITGLGDCTPVSIAVAPNGYVYCVTNTVEQHPKIHRSTDGGIVWKSFEIDVQYSSSWGLRNVYVAGNGDVYVTSLIGVLRSSDKGEHWTQLKSGMTNPLRCRVLGATGDGLIYTVKADEAKLYLFNPTTLQWQTKGAEIHTASSPHGTQFAFASTSFESKEICVTVNEYPYIYRTTDLGASWDSISYNLPIDIGMQQASAVRYDAKGNLYCSVRFKGCYVLERNSHEWKALAVEANGSDCLELFQTKSGAWINAGFGGLYRATDPSKEWVAVKGTRYHDINAISEFEGKYYCHFHDRILVSATSDMDFTRVPEFEQRSRFWTMSTHSHRAMMCFNDSMFMSTDKGQSWHARSYPADEKKEILADLVISDAHSVCVSVDTDYDSLDRQASHLYLSDDQALQWKELALPDSLRYEYLVNTVIHSNDIFVLDASGRISRCSDAQHFETFENGLPSRYCQQILSMESGDLYAVLTEGIYICESGQNTWHKAQYQLPGFDQPKLYCVRSTIHGALTEILVAVGANNLIAIAKQRGPWHDITGIFPFTLPQISGAVVHERSSSQLDVFVSSYGMGIWTVTIGDVTPVEEESNVSTLSTLPQPAKDLSIINLPDNADDDATIEVYSEIGTRLNVPYSFNNRQVQLDCRALVNGVYSLQIKSSGMTRSVPLVICHDCR